MNDAVRLNFKLRTAFRVLYFIKEFKALSANDLYTELKRIDWENILPMAGYFSVTSSVQTASITDQRFANLKCKDAIVDRISESRGRRPDSGPDRNKAVVFLYWKDDYCSIFIDTTGEPLSKRGYRKIPMSAPMQETLAAAVVMSSQWKGDVPFVNPMCGSGTMAIEAALIALNKCPGLLRNNFAFMHVIGFERDNYMAIRNELKAQQTNVKVPIIVTDIDKESVDAARQNARTAGVEQFLEFHECDFRKTPLPETPGIIMLNPPYGLRLSEQKWLEGQYKQIGDFFKQSCAGYKGYIFTGNLDLAKRVGLKTKSRTIFYNSQIESRLLEYELYTGTKKIYNDE